ncbi:MAG: flagellar biosynthetic protein FliP [Mycobacterium sp.]|nr:flagellar biosynthetic protein FliP [Mycobacterium sp.]MCW2744652.1 flagellar biosynthetic protein FliP [Mycobacterium sp.]
MSQVPLAPLPALNAPADRAPSAPAGLELGRTRRARTGAALHRGISLAAVLGAVTVSAVLGAAAHATPASAATLPATVPAAVRLLAPAVDPIPMPTVPPIAGTSGIPSGVPTVSPSSGISATTAPGTGLSVNLKDGSGLLSNPLSVVLLLGLVSIVPALLMMMTAFTRIVIVLGFTRNALSTQSIPPNQVIIGLALFLTMFVMAPTFSKANHDALQPYLKGQITQTEAYNKGIEPFRGFMLKQVRQKDLALFVKLSGKPAPATPDKTPTTTLVPAYAISELRTSFLIGFVIFVPFLVIDLVVSAALSSMGMMMLPPALISLPFKLLLFVAADGWYLVVQSLVQSFH